MNKTSDPNEFWKDRKVCVTGGAGLLGSFVLETLRSRGATEIFVPHIEEYDLTDIDNIHRLLEDAEPDIIIHLAAWREELARIVLVRQSSFIKTL